MTRLNNETPLGCALISCVALLIAIVGQCMNIYKLCNLDFNAPYKAETIRAIGVFTPIGAVVGYINFDEEEGK